MLGITNLILTAYLIFKPEKDTVRPFIHTSHDVLPIRNQQTPSHPRPPRDLPRGHMTICT